MITIEESGTASLVPDKAVRLFTYLMEKTKERTPVLALKAS